MRDGSLSNTRKKEEFFTLATSKLFYMRTNPEEDYILAGETARGFGSKAGWKREREEKETHFWNSTDGFILFLLLAKGSLR